jgi:hypothetical protein
VRVPTAPPARPREGRISIGQIDVRVINQPAPPPAPRPAMAPPVALAVDEIAWFRYRL